MKAKIKHGAIAVLAITALSLVLRLAAPGPDRIKPWWWGVSDAEYQRALREQQAGNYTIIFPTRLNLKMLDESRTVAEAMSAASARKIVTVLPEPAKLGDERALRIPLEAGYGGDVFPVGSDF